MTPAQGLARFVAELNIENLNDDVIEAARRHLFDTVGVALKGAQQKMPRRAFDGLAALPGTRGGVRVWGTDTTMAAPYAALANGVASHVLDFDDTHTAGIVHGSAIIAPTVFALADELDLTGSEAITAFVAGWEVAARVGLAAKGSMHERGYHTSSTAGVFGAAAAASKLLQLDAEQTLHAIALSGSQASGINEYQSDGTSSKILHTGWAAHAGIIAAHLARAGMTGPKSVFEGRLGFLRAYGDIKKCDMSLLNDGLGERWETTLISIKPYPCCHFAHAFIGCARQVEKKGGLWVDVEKIECIVPELEVPMVCEPADLKVRPVSPYAAKFSLPYMVAAAFVDGSVRHSTFTESSIRREEVLRLAEKVTYRTAAKDETTFPTYFPGWILVTLKTGKKIEERIDINLGTPANPLSWQDLESKFLDNVADLGLNVGEIINAFKHLEHVRVREVNEMLAYAPNTMSASA